jgi:hypothetical protein
VCAGDSATRAAQQATKTIPILVVADDLVGSGLATSLAHCEGDHVWVFSRRGNDYTDRVPRITKALASLRVKSVTIDGEGVVCRQDGVSDFDRLRSAVGRLGSRDAFLYAFDLL